MIAILLKDTSFEQDIRELLMAFYPGETFTHKEEEAGDCAIKVYGETVDGSFRMTIDTEAQEVTSEIRPDPDNRFETKNALKQCFYNMLSELTDKELPWGTLTGIRPTKIALTKLYEGKTEDEIRDYMKDTYFTSDEKIELSLDVARLEKKLLDTVDYKDGYSLYIGIPFCPTTCLYCSFTSFPIGIWKNKMDSYLAALFHELDYVAETMKEKKLQTIYFGGGTPTSLEPEHLEAIISHVEQVFDLSHVTEFTVEAGRPDSITEEKLQVLRNHNITRISINPQTMNQKTLDIIGRRHTVERVIEIFQVARSMGFDNINMDLIVGLPGEDVEDVRHTLEEIKKLKPDSLTVHSLAIKRAARLNLQWDQYADMKMVNTQELIDMTAECARELGLAPYYLYRQKNMAGNFENVGYAAPGKECIYNILIMEEKQTIAACGAGTTTKVLYPEENRLERAENVKEVAQYIERIDEMIARKDRLLKASF